MGSSSIKLGLECTGSQVLGNRHRSGHANSKKKAESRSAHPPEQSLLCPWGSHMWNTRTLVLPGEQTQSTICLFFAGGSGSLAIAYYELCSKKLSIELYNTKGKIQAMGVAWNVWSKQNREVQGLKRLQTHQHESSHSSLCG